MTSIIINDGENKHFSKQENKFGKIRSKKILDYAERQLKRTEAQKIADFEELSEEQQRRVEHSMKGPAWTWTRWNGIEEVWDPWNRFSEPINSWYELRTKWSTP